MTVDADRGIADDNDAVHARATRSVRHWRVKMRRTPGAITAMPPMIIPSARLVERGSQVAERLFELTISPRGHAWLASESSPTGDAPR